MRAADRCKEHFRGDRCTLARDHDQSQPPEDRAHVGCFTKWTQRGFEPLRRDAMPRKTYRWITRRANALIQYMEAR